MIYEDLKRHIENGIVFLAERWDGCNHGRFAFLKTVDQLDHFVETVFQESMKTYNAFSETCQTQNITDGYVFTLTLPKLRSALETGTLSAKLDYALAINGSPSSLISFNQVQNNDARLKYLTTHYNQVIKQK